MSLWLLRHAPVQAEPGLCYGRTDLPACETRTQALAVRVAASLPQGIALRSSPLRRCTMLADALHGLREPGASPLPCRDARLAEMDFGAWEGRPWNRIARAELDTWTDSFADGRPGGDGESIRAFMARVAAAYDDWHAGGEDALWVTHAGVIRAVGLLHAGVREVVRADQWPSQAVAFGELLRMG